MLRPIPALLLTLLLAACQPTPPLTVGSTDGREEVHSLPVPGTGQSIALRLCRPDLPGVAPLAVINHGSPADATQRPGMRPAACSAEAVRWFTERGFAVALPMRRGYGASGGAWGEAYGACGAPDFVSGGRESARDIAAAIAYAMSLPGIRPSGVLVVGQSAGGWGSLALAAQNPPAVAAVVNMAGGRGGWAQGRANTNCAPDRLAAAAGEFGRTARVPSLWIYTANDTFFAPDLAAGMHRAYVAAGGLASFAPRPAWGEDGHNLFFGRGGSASWGPVVEPFLRAQGFAPRRP
jgi:dienelactone hydrolase